jgi:long-chain-fatty-acid--CoA ligase ACSBG
LTSPTIPFDERDRIVSFLPMSHIAGYLVDIVAQAKIGQKVYFARPDALSGTLV